MKTINVRPNTHGLFDCPNTHCLRTGKEGFSSLAALGSHRFSKHGTIGSSYDAARAREKRTGDAIVKRGRPPKQQEVVDIPTPQQPAPTQFVSAMVLAHLHYC